MGLETRLLKGESTLSKLNGGDPTIENKKESKLHYDYSLNGQPEILGQPSPSQLDLNGKVPPYNYKDNAPTEGIGRI